MTPHLKLRRLSYRERQLVFPLHSQHKRYTRREVILQDAATLIGLALYLWWCVL